MTEATSVEIAYDREHGMPGQVYRVLRDRIQAGELAPGASINERRLAEWLGVSRTPIREAIRRLATEGLIEVVPNVGTKVALVDPQRIHECCVIRSSLESAAIMEAARRFTPAAGRELERLIEEQEETITVADWPRNIAVDTAFHDVILRLSDLAMVRDIMRGVMGEIVRARHLSIKLPGRLREPIAEHRVILEALRSGEPEASRAAMERHLARSISSIMLVLNANLDFRVKPSARPDAPLR